MRDKINTSKGKKNVAVNTIEEGNSKRKKDQNIDTKK